MEEAAELAARTLDVEYCKILELLPGGEELLLRAGVGWKEGLVGKTKVGAGLDSQAGYALLSDEPVIVEDLRTEGRFNGPPLLLEHGVVSGMSVIIRCLDGPFGVLSVHTGSHREFSEYDVNFLQAVANVLATAVERERAMEKLLEVREAERGRMARDLHDEVLQDLTYALAAMQLAQNQSKDPDFGDTLDRASGALKRASQGVRGAIYDLDLEGDQRQDFGDMLGSLVELNRERWPEAHIELSLEPEFLPPLSRTTEVELARIVGEALSNARRHSGARNVRVAVGFSEDKLWAEVEDDGVGFDPDVTLGTGLSGMRERALGLGGNLTIDSSSTRGTKIRVETSLEGRRDGPRQRTRLLLVEDHASFRDTLAEALQREGGFAVVGKAGSLAEARSMLDGADVAIVDLALPDGFGGDLIKELRTSNPQTQALVLSASLDRAEVARAVESGAAGVLHKSAGMEEILEAVRRLQRGETLMPLEEVVELLRFAGARKDEEFEAQRAMERLTDREMAVLKALAEGLDSPAIAERLGISIKTERNHMASILAKLGVHSRLQALVLALRHGLVEIR
jgi:signal transduction histidine kinase/DNA-binding NarL/FixJ family response regulator